MSSDENRCRGRWILLAILAGNYILRVLIAIRPLKYIDGLTIPDDAYLSLTLARNIAKGLGPLYGQYYTNGFQPLYVFLMTPVYWLFPNDLITPVHIALFVLIAFDTATLYLLYRLAQNEYRSNIAPMIIAIAWIFNPYSIRIANNGLETSISAFFILASYILFVRLREKSDDSIKSLLFFGIILGLSLLSRIDNIILALVLIAGLSWSWWKACHSPIAISKNLGLVLGFTILICLPWITYQLYYIGDLVPISGQAVRYMSLSNINHAPTLANFYLVSLKEAVLAIKSLCLAPLILIVVLLGAVLLMKRTLNLSSIFDRLKKHNPLLIFSLLLFVAYTFFLFQAGLTNRYFYPLTLIVLLYMMTLIDLFNQRLCGRMRLLFNIVVVTFLVGSTIIRPSVRALYFSNETQRVGYMNLGLWAKDNFPDRTVVGCSQTGALGYFAPNLRVVNLDGKVSSACYKSLVAKRNIEYIRSEKIEYVIGWKDNIDFIRRESINFKPDDLILIGPIKGFTSWWTEWYLYKVNKGK
jgi:hypothetical protein